MDNTSKYGKIILLKLKVANSLIGVYNQIIHEQYRVKIMKLSKLTMNTATKLNLSVSLDLNSSHYSKKECDAMDYQATIIVWLDVDCDHEGDAIYKVYTTIEGFKAVLWDVWTNDTSVTFPKSFEDEKGLRAALKMINKNK